MNNENESKYPGYPHYPASEDITRKDNNNGQEQVPEEKDGSTEEGPVDVTDNDADVTAEDLEMLDAADNGSIQDDANLIEAELDDTDDDGEPLNENSRASYSGNDLDVPGSEDDDTDEVLGEEDEENNYYSLGGDNHEAQEENNGDQ